MSNTIQSIPREDGFRMPGEFEPHAGTWMLWPERTDTWRLGAKPAQVSFVAIASAISQFEPVTMGVSRGQFRNARRVLPPHIRVVEMSSNDAWMRDCGPTFITNDHGVVRGLDWDFNAWGGLAGGLYFPWDLDDQVAQKVMEIERIDRYKVPLIMEGGSIHVDGDGTLITTEECLLNPNRNPKLTKEEIERYLADYLNVQKIIWLKRGIVKDETSGHVDNMCCFIRPGSIALAWTDNNQDPQHEVSSENLEILQSATDARGRKLQIHKIHTPEPIFITPEEAQGLDTVEGTLPRQPGLRLAGSYINFYLCNNGAVVPLFNDTQDRMALDTLQKLFPERKVIGVYAREILLGGGNIHCITQQQPLGRSLAL